VSKAVDRGRVSPDEARHVLGGMLLDLLETGADRDLGAEWRMRLLDLGVAEQTLDALRGALSQCESGEQPSVVSSRRPYQVDAVVAHVGILGDPADWEPAVEYASTAMALMDSVWSIGVRYQGVLNVLDRYRRLRAASGADSERDTPADLVTFIEGLGGPEAFADAVQNRQRTSSTSGILKAEAVFLESRFLEGEAVATPADLLGASPEKLDAIRARWVSVPGQGSGLSLDYFLMLSGLPGVKADRMVRRFVAAALELPNELAISAEDAGALVREAAWRLDTDERVLDYAVWRFQSSQ
jgi:hypothetical protein